MLLIGFHVYLVRKHGVAPVPGDEQLPRRSSIPARSSKTLSPIFIAFAILFVMAIAVRVPLEQLADPTDTHFTPASGMVFPVPVPDF